MAGYVGQWTSDWYRPDYYRQLAAAGTTARNPQGPETAFDSSEPSQAKKVHREGSFLCTAALSGRLSRFFAIDDRYVGYGSASPMDIAEGSLALDRAQIPQLIEIDSGQ